MIKSILSLLFVLLLCLSCDNSVDRREVKSFIAQMKKDLLDAERFDEKEYFTSSGWLSFSRNFRNNESREHFATFLSRQKVSQVIISDNNTFRVLLGKRNRTNGRIGLVVSKKSEGFKITEYLPGR